VKTFKFFFISFLIVLITASSAQVLVGPVVGGQVNFFTYDDKGYKDLYSLRPSASYHIGASVEFRIHKTFFLQTSFLYNERKKVMDGKADPLFRHEMKNRFIDVPILFTKEVKVKFGTDKYYKWYLGVGPNVSYWLGGKGVFKNSELNENEINPPNYDLPYELTFSSEGEIKQGEMNISQPNRFQLGLNFSGGLIFEPENLNKFMITARYQMGHTFMSEKSKGDFGINELTYAEDLRFRNQSISLSLYYFIDLKTSERKRGASTIKPKQRK
jgi:Outer membrane protein beta-barrel domain